MCAQINIHQAKTHFSSYIQKVQSGEEIIIARDGEPVAKLIPYSTKKKSRKPGAAKGEVIIRKDFDDPLPAKFLKSFYK